MSSNAPDWLQAALKDQQSQHAGLAVAKLADARALGRGGFALSSPAFENGGELDPCFSADEEDAVAPPFDWTAPPPGAMELVLIAEDASSPESDPACHWLVWGLAAQRGKLLEGEVPPRVGKNSLRNSEWQLLAPPHDDEAHHYVFQLFALDLPLTLMPGASREDLLASMKGHVIAAAVLVGTYARQDEDSWEEEVWEEEE